MVVILPQSFSISVICEHGVEYINTQSELDRISIM